MITPVVTSRTREFVEGHSDVDRSVSVGRVVVPLVLLVLIESELLAAARRPSRRIFLAFGILLALSFAMLVLAQVHPYLA